MKPKHRWLCVFAFAVLLLPAVAAAQATGLADASSDAITTLAKKALAYAAVLGAAGTVSMAFVELLKGVFDIRRMFQQRQLDTWLKGQAAEVKAELLYLAIGDQARENVLCGQPIEKMMGQIQAGARIALEYPQEFPNIFKFLTTSDFETQAPTSPAGQAALHDRALWSAHATQVHNLAAHLPAGPPTTPVGPTTTASADQSASTSVLASDQQTIPVNNVTTSSSVGGAATVATTASDAAQARARLASLVSRKLDGFQLRTDFVWSRFNQGLSILGSIAICEFALSGYGALNINAPERLILGVIGGLLAPFAKDFSQSLASFASK